MSIYRDALDKLGCILAELNSEDCMGCHCLYSDCGNSRFDCKGVSELKILDEAVSIAENVSRGVEDILYDIANIRKEYNKLKTNGMTKKDMCDLVVPFRDRYGLRDVEALHIVRDNINIDELLSIAIDLKRSKEVIDTVSKVDLEKLVEVCNSVLGINIYVKLVDDNIGKLTIDSVNFHSLMYWGSLDDFHNIRNIFLVDDNYTTVIGASSLGFNCFGSLEELEANRVGSKTKGIKEVYSLLKDSISTFVNARVWMLDKNNNIYECIVNRVFVSKNFITGKVSCSIEGACLMGDGKTDGYLFGVVGEKCFLSRVEALNFIGGNSR